MHFSSLCYYLVVGREASTGSHPGNLGRRISRCKAVELQTLALLDISYRWLDGDHWQARVRCTNKNTCITSHHVCLIHKPLWCRISVEPIILHLVSSCSAMGETWFVLFSFFTLTVLFNVPESYVDWNYYCKITVLYVLLFSQVVGNLVGDRAKRTEGETMEGYRFMDGVKN